MIICNSQIKHVTVYSDKAAVIRIGTVKVNKGINLIVFKNLPKLLIDNSISISGTGTAVLNDIKIVQIKDIITDNKEIEQLKAGKSELEKKLTAINDQIAEHAHTRNLIQSIANKLTSPAENTEASVFNIEKWKHLISFFKEENELNNNNLRTLEIQHKTISDDLENVNFKLKNNSTNNFITYKQAEIVLRSETDTELELLLTYMVPGATWIPSYFLKIFQNTEKLICEYNAEIKQFTGEEWNNVSLTLSTAKTNIGGQIPELLPWRIKVAENYDSDENIDVERFDKKRKKATPVLSSKVSPLYEREEEINIPVTPEVTVSEGLAAFSFLIDKTTTIPSDNTLHKTTVLISELPATFSHIAAPQVSEFVYLWAEVTNTSKFPLLKGETHIFMDNNFISKSKIDLVTPGKKFNLSLGVDESIQAKYELINKLEKNEGIFSKKRKINFEYKLSVANNKSKNIKILVKVNTPLSMHNDIVVELMEPKIKENSELLSINELRIINWNNLVKPTTNNPEIMVVKFGIEFPREMNIEGLLD